MSCFSGAGAVLGGVGGFLIGGPAGALIGAGVLGSAGGSIDASNAQQDIATMQMQMAQQVLQMQQQSQKTALGLAQPSMSELGMIQQQQQLASQSLTTQLASIQQDQQLLNSVDPALKDAGVQAYQMLQGKQAAALGPVQAQLDKQRAALGSQLNSQLGPGWQTSTAGQQAMANFDAQAALTTSQVQSQTLNSFLGVSAGVRPNIPGLVSGAYASSAAIDQSALAAQQNIQGRQVAAWDQTMPNYQSVISTAGAPGVGALGTANTFANLFGSAAGLGGIMLGNQLQSQSLANLFGPGTAGQTGGVPMSAMPQGGFGGAGGFTYGGGSMVPTGYNSPNFGTLH